MQRCLFVYSARQQLCAALCILRGSGPARAAVFQPARTCFESSSAQPANKRLTTCLLPSPAILCRSSTLRAWRAATAWMRWAQRMTRTTLRRRCGRWRRGCETATPLIEQETIKHVEPSPSSACRNDPRQPHQPGYLSALSNSAYNCHPLRTRLFLWSHCHPRAPYAITRYSQHFLPASPASVKTPATGPIVSCDQQSISAKALLIRDEQHSK